MSSRSLSKQFKLISHSIRAEFEVFEEFKTRIQSAGFSEDQRAHLMPFETELAELGKTMKDQAKGAELMVTYIKRKSVEIDSSDATTTRLTDIAETEQESTRTRIARLREIMKSVEAQVL